ncbi:DotU family type IV/VI secretion system protein [Robbsia sp. Bb-Pol-6]|uniref:DotU family type IV/VI secretion system protein n=1 Tax=Robbsia betulipollinis TaxID=2981849 RepID=A0ABT3ZKB3_9BURK|nr:DotU family type IV/VI secretion system protein [Robbsia betulipollinis]MCY0386969.1 DotU family type IV/VI secretion system protein [Robbsia betulipollinis]
MHRTSAVPASQTATSRNVLKTDDELMTEQFRAFIDEVRHAPARVLDVRQTDPELAAVALNQHLQRLIELQSAQIERQTSRLEVDNVADARYLKTALADELLLTMPWPGRDRWTAHLLESAFFRTNIAGDLVFERIDVLLADREPSRRKMARLYLFALAIGFQGRFRGDAALERLTAYRTELFQFVYQRRPDLGGRDRVLDDDAYAHTLSHLAQHNLPPLSRWTLGVVVAVIGLLATSEILWLSTTWPVREALHHASVE